MKKLIAILAVMLVFTGSVESAAKKTSKAKSKSSSTALAVKKGETRKYGDFLTVQNFTCKTKRAEFSVDYPVSGNQALVSNMRDSIRDLLNPNFRGSLETPDALIRSAVKLVDRDCSEETEISIKSYNDKSVVLSAWGYEMYEGAAHPMHFNYARNFRVSDGMVLTPSMLPAFSAIKPLVIEGLARNWDVAPAQVKDYLFDESDIDYPLNVYFNDKGLVLEYTVYEIAPYSSGAPEAEIPFSSNLVDKLSPEAKTFF